jgi:hypothetical protein
MASGPPSACNGDVVQHKHVGSDDDFDSSRRYIAVWNVLSWSQPAEERSLIVTVSLKLHGRIVEDAGQFRAECWLQDEDANPSKLESRLFMTLQDARIWLEQLSHERGYDRIWLERDTGDAGLFSD